MLAPLPLGSWRPLLGEILDPPLRNNVQGYSREQLVLLVSIHWINCYCFHKNN